MPLLAAVMVVNHRHRTTETRVVPLAAPSLWTITARSVGAALSAVRSLLDRPIATRHSTAPRSSRWLPWPTCGQRPWYPRLSKCRPRNETTNAPRPTTPSRTAPRTGRDPLTRSSRPAPPPAVTGHLSG
jgi:hypothetical protein